MIKDLDFKNETETQAFNKFSEKDKASYLPLFMCSFSGSTGYNLQEAQKRIDDCVATIKKETEGKTEAKRVKYVYQYVHKHFFSTYKLRNSFCDIFIKGEYNCVSASALYAIVFNLLDIPFQVMEAPRHVFLIAYPNSHRILIESTSPEDGYNAYSESYVEKYVRSLYASKVISKEDFETKPLRQLFEKYYYASSDVSLKQLAGIQYSNYGIYYMDDQEYDKGSSEFKKAYFLNPDERGKYLLRSSLATLIDNNNYKKMEDVRNLSLLCRYNNSGDVDVNTEFIKNQFYRLVEAQLIENSDYEKFDKSFLLLEKTIKDTLLRNEIAFVYHYELGRLAYVNLKSDNYIMEHLQGAYLLKPGHANLQTMIIAYLGQKLEKDEQITTIVKLMDDFAKKFDFINTNKHFLGIKANCFLEQAYQSFSFGDLTKGEMYLKNFESLHSTDPEKQIEPKTYYIEKAYSEGAGLYYKKGNRSKSKQLLKKGLTYAPESYPLRIRLEQL